MSEANTNPAQDEVEREPVSQQERWRPWLLRLRIIVLGVSLGLVAKWLQNDWPARRAPANPPVQVKDASEKAK